MKDSNDKLKRGIWRKFMKQQNVFLATAEDDQPRLRPVTLIRLKDRLFFATGSNNDKVRQITRNPKTEFCLMFGKKGNRGAIRAECMARIVKEKDVKAEVFENIPLLGEFWRSPQDSSFALIELQPVGFQYHQPGSKEAIRTDP